MKSITDDILKITYELRDELKVLEERINHYDNNKALNEEEYKVYKMLLEKCHDSLRKKIHLLATILETDSTEILDIVEQKKLV